MAVAGERAAEAAPKRGVAVAPRRADTEAEDHNFHGERLMKRSVLTQNESGGAFSRLMIGVLAGRRLHEIARWPDQRPADAAIERNPGAAHRVDDNACGIRRVPDFQLQFRVERHAAKRRAFQPDIGPLAVGEPRHMVTGADMDVAGREWDIKLAADRLCFGYFFGLQALALEHIEKVGISAKIELKSAIDAHAALAKQVHQSAVKDGGAYLAFDIVADEREAAF